MDDRGSAASTSSSATIKNPSQDVGMAGGWTEEMSTRYPVEYTTSAPAATAAHVAATSNNPAFGTASRRYKEAQEAVRREKALQRFVQTLCEDEDELRLLQQPAPPTVDLGADPQTQHQQHYGGDEEMEDVWGPKGNNERTGMLKGHSRGTKKGTGHSTRRWMLRVRSLLFPECCGSQMIYILGFMLIMVIFMVIPITVLTQMYEVSSGRDSFGRDALNGPVVTVATLANVNQMFAVLMALGISPTARPLSQGGAHITYSEINSLMVDGLGVRSAVPSQLFESHSDLADAASESSVFSSAAAIATSVSWLQMLLDPSRLLSGPLAGHLKNPRISQHIKTISPSLGANPSEAEAALHLRTALSSLLGSTSTEPAEAGMQLLKVAQQDAKRVAGLTNLKDIVLSITTSLLDGITQVPYTMPEGAVPTSLVTSSMSQLEILAAFQPLLRIGSSLCNPRYSTRNNSACEGPTSEAFLSILEGVAYTFEHTLLSVMRTLSKAGEGSPGWDHDFTQSTPEEAAVLVDDLYGGRVSGLPVGGVPARYNGGFEACNENIRKRLPQMRRKQVDESSGKASQRSERAQHFIRHEDARVVELEEFTNATDIIIDLLVEFQINITAEAAVKVSTQTATPSHTTTLEHTPTNTPLPGDPSPFESITLGYILDTLYAVRRARVLRVEMWNLQSTVERTQGVESQSNVMLDSIGMSMSDVLRTLQSGSPLDANLSPTSLIAALIASQRLLEAALYEQLSDTDTHFEEFLGGASLGSPIDYLHLPARAAANIQIAVVLCTILPALVLAHILYGLSIHTSTSFLPHRLLIAICVGMYLVLVIVGGLVGGVGVDAVTGQANYDEERAHWMAVKRDILGIALRSNETANAALLTFELISPSDIYALYDGIHRFEAVPADILTSSALLSPSIYSTLTSSFGVNSDPTLLGGDAINSTALKAVLETVSGNNEQHLEKGKAAWRTIQNVTCSGESIVNNNSEAYQVLRSKGCRGLQQGFLLAVSALLAPTLSTYNSNATADTDVISPEFTSQGINEAVRRLNYEVSPHLIHAAMNLLVDCENVYLDLRIPFLDSFIQEDARKFRYCSKTGTPSLLRQRDGITGYLLAGGMTEQRQYAVGPFAVPYDGANISCTESTRSMNDIISSGVFLTSANATKHQIQALLQGIEHSYANVSISAKSAILLRRRSVVWVSGISLLLLQVVAMGVYLLVFEYPTPSSLLL